MCTHILTDYMYIYIYTSTFFSFLFIKYVSNIFLNFRGNITFNIKYNMFYRNIFKFKFDNDDQLIWFIKFYIENIHFLLIQISVQQILNN